MVIETLIKQERKGRGIRNGLLNLERQMALLSVFEASLGLPQKPEHLISTVFADKIAEGDYIPRETLGDLKYSLNRTLAGKGDLRRVQAVGIQGDRRQKEYYLKDSNPGLKQEPITLPARDVFVDLSKSSLVSEKKALGERYWQSSFASIDGFHPNKSRHFVVILPPREANKP